VDRRLETGWLEERLVRPALLSMASDKTLCVNVDDQIFSS
jgi:hypothetical protein